MKTTSRRESVEKTLPSQSLHKYGDKNIFFITNSSKSSATAKTFADIYRDRWTIETSFQELEKWFNSEINTLGYPPSALFAFCISLISYMIISVIKESTVICAWFTEN